MKLYHMYIIAEQSVNGCPAILEFGTDDWSVDLYDNLSNPDMEYHSEYGVDIHHRVPTRTKMKNHETN